MKPQFRPLLAYDATKTPINFPVLVSPKIDGIRCLMGPEGPVSRTLKPIPNKFIREYLRRCPPGLDGELTVGSSFQQSTSGIMSHEGEPDFTYHVFDTFTDPSAPFEERLYAASVLVSAANLSRVHFLMHRVVRNQADLDEAETQTIEGGFEGLMIRRPRGPYKYGRSTPNESILGKIKRFEDAEATCIGIEPLLRNHNAPETDALGLQRRGTSNENKVETSFMGALVVKNDAFAKEFRIGTGFTAAQRSTFFHNPPLGQVVKFKYLPHGTIDLPRHPVFLGIRHADDR
jgi:DNA ligase-1